MIDNKKRIGGRCQRLEIEILPELLELLLIQSAESGLTIEELIKFAFGNYIKKEK